MHLANSEVIPWHSANQPVVPEIKARVGLHRREPWIFQTGLRIWQARPEIRTGRIMRRRPPPRPTPALRAVRPPSPMTQWYKFWQRSIITMTLCFSAHVCVYTYLHDERRGSGPKSNKNGGMRVGAGLCNRLIKFKFPEIKERGQTPSRATLFKRVWMSCCGLPCESNGTPWPATSVVTAALGGQSASLRPRQVSRCKRSNEIPKWRKKLLRSELN